MKMRNVDLAVSWNKISLTWRSKITKTKTEIKISSMTKTHKQITKTLTKNKNAN